MKSHFALVWSINDEISRSHGLISPQPMEQDDFEKLCYDLIPQAGTVAMEKCKSLNYPVGWVEIVESLCDILIKEHGFELFSPKKIVFKGSWMISDQYPPKEDDNLLGKVRRELAEFNDKTCWDAYNTQVVS